MEKNNEKLTMWVHILSIFIVLLLMVITFLALKLHNTQALVNKYETETSESQEYDVSEEISAGRIVYGAYYDDVIDVVKPKLYSVYFRGNDSFDFYEMDYDSINNGTEITPQTPKEKAYTIKIDEVTEVGGNVEHLKSLESYTYGTVLSGRYITPRNTESKVTVIKHNTGDYITIYVHNDGDTSKTGNAKGISMITLSTKVDYGTYHNLYHYNRLKDVTEFGEQLNEDKDK